MTPPSDPVEDMLRRTFTARAEDMAPGDGAEWNPTDAPAAADVPGPSAGPARSARRAAKHRPDTSWKPLWRRPVGVAAMAVAVAVVAAAGVALLGGGDSDDETDIAAVTTSTRPPLEESGQNLSASSQLGGVVDDLDSDNHLFVTWYPLAPGQDAPLPDTAESVGPNPDGGATWIATVAPEGGEALLYRWTVYEDGYIEAIAVGMTREHVLATLIERTDPAGDEFTLTPPAGFSILDADPPG